MKHDYNIMITMVTPAVKGSFGSHRDCNATNTRDESECFHLVPLPTSEEQILPTFSMASPNLILNSLRPGRLDDPSMWHK